jgi:hypothetical protein
MGSFDNACDHTMSEPGCNPELSRNHRGAFAKPPRNFHGHVIPMTRRGRSLSFDASSTTAAELAMAAVGGSRR